MSLKQMSIESDEWADNPHEHPLVKSGFCYVCTKDGCGQVVHNSEQRSHLQHHGPLLHARRKAERRKREKKEKEGKNTEQKERRERRGRDNRDDDYNGAGPSNYVGHGR
jgi:hypothetical protein